MVVAQQVLLNSGVDVVASAHVPVADEAAAGEAAAGEAPGVELLQMLSAGEVADAELLQRPGVAETSARREELSRFFHATDALGCSNASQ